MTLAAMRRTERGSTVVEYAMLMALVVVLAVGALTFVGLRTKDKIDAGAGLDAGGAVAVEATPSGGTPPVTCAGNSGSAGKGNGNNCGAKK